METNASHKSCKSFMLSYQVLRDDNDAVCDATISSNKLYTYYTKCNGQYPYRITLLVIVNSNKSFKVTTTTTF